MKTGECLTSTYSLMLLLKARRSAFALLFHVVLLQHIQHQELNVLSLTLEFDVYKEKADAAVCMTYATHCSTLARQLEVWRITRRSHIG